jgi:hypothetical protein
MRYEWPLSEGRRITRSDHFPWIVIKVFEGVYIAAERIGEGNAVKMLEALDGELQYWSNEAAAWRAIDETIAARQ